MTPRRRTWFNAPDTASQHAFIAELERLAADTEGQPWPRRSEAVRGLIELMHLSRHTRERVRLVHALGRVRHFNAVPALHAETHHPDPAVRQAALTSIGRLGFGFGGTMVARWLRLRCLDDEPRPVLEAALTALARTGHPHTGREGARLWETGRVGPSVLHGALADAAAPELLALAREHVGDPGAATAAALHLEARRVPDLARALSPMLRSVDLAQVQLAERLIEHRWRDPQTELLELVGRTGTAWSIGRAARRLRAHPAAALAEAFAALAEMTPPGDPEAGSLVARSLLVGEPTLQHAALGYAASAGPAVLADALRGLMVDSPGLREDLDGWARSPDHRVRVGAIRARSNVFGADALAASLALATGPQPADRLECARALINILRDQRGPDGRTRLAGPERASVERAFRTLLDQPDTAAKALAAFGVGNIGLTALGDTLQRLLDPANPVSVRQAAATALSELPVQASVAPLVDRLCGEGRDDVAFRLGLALMRGLERGLDPGDRLAEAVAVCAAARPDVAVVGVRLAGFAGGDDTLEGLCADAAGGVQARAVAALTALGSRGGDAAIATLVGALQHPDEARRIRAAEALGALGAGEEALVDAVCREDEPEARAAAVAALAGRPLPAALRRRLQPRGPEDPLLFELLELTAAGGAGGIQAAHVDARLLDAIPGFDPARLHRRCPDALRALRTAEFLTAVGDLPAGMDAAPPVLFWVKSLEIWLLDVAGPALRALRRPDRVAALEALVGRWRGLAGEAAGWPPGAHPALWARLIDQLLRALRAPEDRVPGLRVMAAVLLVTGPLAARTGLPTWGDSLPPVDRGRLAHALAELARLRNPLTHQRAGTRAEAAGVRALALQASGLVVRLGG